MPVGKNSIKRATGGTAAKATFAVEEMAKAPAQKPAAKPVTAAKKPAAKPVTAAKKPAAKPVADDIHEKKFEAARAMFCALPDYLL